MERIVKLNCDRYEGKHISSYTFGHIDVDPNTDQRELIQFSDYLQRLSNASEMLENEVINGMEKIEVERIRLSEIEEKINEGVTENPIYVGLKKDYETIQGKVLEKEKNIEQLKLQLKTLQKTKTDKGLRKQLANAETRLNELEAELKSYHEGEVNDVKTGLQRFESRQLKSKERRIETLESELEESMKEIVDLKRNDKVYRDSYDATIPILLDVSRKLPDLIEYLSQIENNEENFEKIREKSSTFEIIQVNEENPIESLNDFKEQFSEGDISIRNKLDELFVERNPVIYQKYVAASNDVETLKSQINAPAFDGLSPEVKEQLIGALRKALSDSEKVVRDYESTRDNLVEIELDKVNECLRAVDEIDQTQDLSKQENLESMLGGRNVIPIMVRTSKRKEEYSVEMVLPIDGDKLDEYFPGVFSNENGSSGEIRRIANAFGRAFILPDKNSEISELVSDVKIENIGEEGSRLLSYSFSLPLNEGAERVTQISRDIVNSVIGSEATVRLDDYGIRFQTIGIYEHYPLSEKTEEYNEFNGVREQIEPLNKIDTLFEELTRVLKPGEEFITNDVKKIALGLGIDDTHNPVYKTLKILQEKKLIEKLKIGKYRVLESG
jgi:hypothetical protein